MVPIILRCTLRYSRFSCAGKYWISKSRSASYQETMAFLMRTFGPFDIDCFASQFNKKCSLYFFKLADSNALWNQLLFSKCEFRKSVGFSSSAFDCGDSSSSMGKSGYGHSDMEFSIILLAQNFWDFYPIYIHSRQFKFSKWALQVPICGYDAIHTFFFIRTSNFI